MQETEQIIEVGRAESTARVLARLREVPAGTRVRLTVPPGAGALQSSDEASDLHALQLDRRLDLTVVSPDHALIVRCRIYGFGVEEIRPPAPTPPPGPDARGGRRHPGTLAAPARPAAPPPILAYPPSTAPPPAYALQIGRGEGTAAILKRLEHLAAGTHIRLQIPVGAVALRSPADCGLLKDLRDRRAIHLTLVTPDEEVIANARNCGLAVEDVRRHKTATAVLAPIPAAPPPPAAGPPPAPAPPEPLLAASPGEYSVEVTADDRSPDLLRRLEALPAGSTVRLHFPPGARVLRTAESYKLMRYVRDRHAQITVVSPEQEMVDLAQTSGWGGEWAPAGAAPAPPPAAAAFETLPLAPAAEPAAPVATPEPAGAGAESSPAALDSPGPAVLAGAQAGPVAEAPPAPPLLESPPAPDLVAEATDPVVVERAAGAAGGQPRVAPALAPPAAEPALRRHDRAPSTSEAIPAWPEFLALEAEEEYQVELGLREPIGDLLSWLETVPAGSMIRLSIPGDGIALHSAGDYQVLKALVRQRQVSLVITSDHPGILRVAQAEGFAVAEEALPAPPEVVAVAPAPPAPALLSPEARTEAPPAVEAPPLSGRPPAPDAGPVGPLAAPAAPAMLDGLPALNLEVGPQESAAGLLARIADVGAGARIRLYIPPGALGAWKIKDYKQLRDTIRARQVGITLISSDPAIISMACIYGFPVESVRALRPIPPLLTAPAAAPRSATPAAIARPPLGGHTLSSPAGRISRPAGAASPGEAADEPALLASLPEMLRRGLTDEDLLRLVALVQQHGGSLDGVAVQSAQQAPTHRLHEPISAFANNPGGGILLFGLDDSRGYEVLGAPDPTGLLTEILRLAAAEMEPPLRPRVTITTIDGKPVVGVTIPELAVDQKPAFYKPDGLQNGAFTRVGHTNQPMGDYEIFNYVNSRIQAAFDAAPVPGATLEDLDTARLAEYLGVAWPPAGAALDAGLENRLLKRGIVQPADGLLRPTLAGLLMFGHDPQAFEPQLVITFLHYYGTTEHEKGPRGERFLDNRKFGGAMPDMVEAVLNHLLASIRKSSRIRGLRREDTPEYPLEAVREALVNAVVHRDYSPRARGSYVQIRLFADRLEIQSPGGLYGNVTESTLEEEQSTRNGVLMRLMEDSRFAENRGSGIRSIIASMREANLEPPRLQDKRSSFWVVLRNHPLMSPEIQTWLNQFAGLPLNAHQWLALAYLRHNTHMTASDYQRLNEIEPAVARGELRGLVRAGLLDAQLGGEQEHYTLKPDPAPAPVPEPAGI